MPIRPENRHRYPKDWPAISLARREAAGWRCEECNLPHGAWGWRDGAGRFHRVNQRVLRRAGFKRPPFKVELPGLDRRSVKVIEIVLTVAHLNHTPEDCSDENLKALCQRCHNLLDGPMRRAGMAARAREAMGTLDMFEEPAG